MRTFLNVLILVLLFTAISIVNALPEASQNIIITLDQPAQMAYDKGFAKQLMRKGDEAVKLWNHTLIENDSPGAGPSNKGAFLEPVYGNRMIKKILNIEEPNCEVAHVMVYLTSSGMEKLQDKPPLSITINGHKTTGKIQNTEQYLYIPIQPSWLKKGDNEIILACPETKDQDSGYIFFIARADEYKAGGWDLENMVSLEPPIDDELQTLFKGVRDFRKMKKYPKNIGNYSLISTNGGRKWSTKGKGLHPQKTNMFATETKFDRGGVAGEYCVRLNLQQYVSEGVLISPVIDLWSEPDKRAALIPFTEVEKLTFNFKGTTPPGTKIDWQIRAGLSMDPCSEQDWSQWLTLTTDASATVQAVGRVKMPPSHWDPERSVTLPKVRYIQWRAKLTTTDHLVSPSVESVSIESEIKRRMEVPKNIIVLDYHNSEIMYSSTGFTYQSAEEPMNKVVIDRDDLERVVAGAGGEFDAIVRLLDFASRRWVYSGPALEYPKWNTVDMSERAHSLGDGGMCIQYAAYLAHILTVMGYHARHVNIQYHEVTEVWCNEFDKWLYLDPTQGVDLYKYDKKTGVPLSLYDIHRAYYEYYNVKTPIDWMKDAEPRRKLLIDFKDFPYDFSTTDPRIELSHKDWEGYYILLEFLRMMPRNDFSTTTIPEPLMQGCMQWSWDGYINWYDKLSPPKLQYSWYTDRECDFWPTLNRVRFEAVPEINGDMVFVTMTTFTPSFKTFQIRTDNNEWVDSDKHYTWYLHSGKNILEMRAVSKFSVCGPPSRIECNFVAKHIAKPVGMGSMNQ